MLIEQSKLDNVKATVRSKGMLDAAIENFRIAREYMDDATYGVEQKLTSFYLGVGLLAKPQPNLCDLVEAERLFLEARDWYVEETTKDLLRPIPGLKNRASTPENRFTQMNPSSREDQKKICKLGITRIRAEASYNLGAAYELQGKYSKASGAYNEARLIVRTYREEFPLQIAGQGLPTHDSFFLPILILSLFGKISADSANGLKINETSKSEITELREFLPPRDAGRNTSERVPWWKFWSQQSDQETSQVSAFNDTLDQIQVRLLEIESQPQTNLLSEDIVLPEMET